MSNEKHYPLHPNATHPPIMTCEIPLEEYESIKRENAELKDKCQMHDFFWEGCGFAKRGFKNTIAVSEAFDKLEEENAELKAKVDELSFDKKLLENHWESEKIRCESASRDCIELSNENAKLVSKIESLKVGHRQGIANLKSYYKAKLESVQASMYCDVVDANMENRRLKRALWMARAERALAEWAHWATIWFCDTNVELNINKSSVSQDPYRCTTKRNAAIWRNIWYEVERKCLAKAEEYK